MITPIAVEIYTYGGDTQMMDLGAVTLSFEGREFIYDIVESYSTDSEGEDSDNLRTCEVKVDKDVFPDCKYDLTEHDLLSYHNQIKGTLFVGGDEFEGEVVSMTLFVKVQSVTVAINLAEE